MDNAALACCDLVPGLHMAMPTQDAAVVILAELRRLNAEIRTLREQLSGERQGETA